MAPRPSIRLFLDWDGTIAFTDTLSVIASIGYAKNSELELLPWTHFLEAYMSDSTVHTASYRPQRADRKFLDQELLWLESLIEIERASVERVESAGIFANVTSEDIQMAAIESAEKQEVRLRPGMKDLLQVLHDINGNASIISVNWSRRFIADFLRTTINAKGWSWPFQAIYANEIEFGPSARLDRYFIEENRGIWTAKDKLRVLREVLGGHHQRETSVYVGDSSTDLECLLSVDVGICMRDKSTSNEQKSLAEALTRLGIPCNWIGEYRLPTWSNEEPLRPPGKGLWWARDFKDIVDSALFDN